MAETHRREWKPSRHLTHLPPSRGLTVDLGCISHYLHDRHIRPLRELIPDAAVSRRIVHRYAARAVMRAGWNLLFVRAGAELDLPATWPAGTNWRIHQWIRHNSTADELQMALQAVVDRLTDDPPTIDYRRRRQALRHWLIPTNVWTPVIRRFTEEHSGDRDLHISTT